MTTASLWHQLDENTHVIPTDHRLLILHRDPRCDPDYPTWIFYVAAYQSMSSGAARIHLDATYYDLDRAKLEVEAILERNLGLDA